jgi:hypothetical protein
MAKETYEIHTKSKDGVRHIYEFVIDRISKDVWDIESCTLWVESPLDFSLAGQVDLDKVAKHLVQKLEEEIWGGGEQWAI